MKSKTGLKLSLPEVTASVAHALNNLLTTLYGAESHLEKTTESVNVLRASAAIRSASAEGQALGAALYLLSLTEADASAFVSGGNLFDATEQERIFDALRDVASVHCAEPVTAKDLKIRLDPDTIKALLICAAFSMRWEAGPREIIRCSTRIEEDEVLDIRALIFQLDSPHMAGRQVSASTRFAHPCMIAMEYAASIIPVESANLRSDSAVEIRLRLLA